MVGYGRLLEKQGFTLKPSHGRPEGIRRALLPGSFDSDQQYAATPNESAEGLYLAGQAYDKAGDKPNAKAQYDKLIATYGTTRAGLGREGARRRRGSRGRWDLWDRWDKCDLCPNIESLWVV